MYILDGREQPQSLPDRGKDKLNFDALNSLQQPILARFCGGHEWEVLAFEVECALVRFNVGGLPEVKCFSEVMCLTDGNGNCHDADDFWND